jgi:hypothetical protein
VSILQQLYYYVTSWDEALFWQARIRKQETICIRAYIISSESKETLHFTPLSFILNFVYALFIFCCCCCRDCCILLAWSSYFSTRSKLPTYFTIMADYGTVLMGNWCICWHGYCFLSLYFPSFSSLKMLSWNSSQKLVVNIFATEVVKKTTNAIVLIPVIFMSFNFCRLLLPKVSRVLNFLWSHSRPFTSWKRRQIYSFLTAIFRIVLIFSISNSH